MNLSFQINLVLGIGGTVNLFLMYLDHEFSLGWFLFSFVILGSNVWLISLKTLHAQERKEMVWAKHGIWTVGVVPFLSDCSNTGNLQSRFSALQRS